MRYLSYLLVGLLFTGFVACKEETSKEKESFRIGAVSPYGYEAQKTLKTDSAAVVSAHPLASEVGKQILKRGGNAIDASIAVQYALAVVYPLAGNIGGGGFMVIHTAEGESHSIDFRETAPSGADRDMYLDSTGQVIARKSLDGHLAPGVPGTVAGTYLAHKKYGKLPMKELIKPAIKLAENGFAITALAAKHLNGSGDDFRQFNEVSNAFEKEEQWQAGDTLIQTDLAHTLQRIAENGKKEFYEGKTAELIVKEMQRGKGIITAKDLKNYKPVERDPRIFSYKDAQIVAMGLPSSGGIMLQQMLTMLKPYDLKEMGYHSAEAVNHIVEVERRAYADRSDYLGDPDFVDVPVDKLLDQAYLKNRMKDFEPGKAGNSENIAPGLTEGEETTHLSVLDKEGNAVAVTTTLNTRYGSRVVVGNAGFLLNNEMDDFSAKPGVPNTYGLLGTEANAIAPNKRMVSSMTPTIVLKKGKPYIVVGTPGGSTIITSVLQSILNVMAFDLSPEKAVNNPKYHHQWKPDTVFVEQDFPKEVRTALKTMGYNVVQRGSIGRTEMILVKEGEIEAAADKRGDDSAAGY